MSNNKKSSVEWLLYEISLTLEGRENSSIPHYKLMELGKQAIAMHKEEIVQTYDDGIMKGRHEDGIEYYTYIFGSNKEQT